MLLEQIEKRERGLFAAIFYTIKIMIEQCDRGPRLGMGADVGCRTHLCIFLTEFEHRKAKFGEQFIVFRAHYFHLFQTIGVARQRHLFAWLRNECGERIVGIDQSEQEWNGGGTIVGETPAIDLDAVETSAITLHGIGRIDEEGSLVKTLNLTRQTRRLFVGSATGESEERKTKREKGEFHDHLVDNNLHTNGECSNSRESVVAED